MKWLSEHVLQIEELLSQHTPQSLTYAALRCRMALELVCYHRLRVAHEYISGADLKRWQPSKVVNKLIQDVDPRIASSYTFSISKAPLQDGANEPTLAEYEDHEYVEVGRQAGFDVKKLGQIWNSLGSFLHVLVPTSHDAELTTFGSVEVIERKVREALAMLKEIERGTMVSSGVGETVTFECKCGSKNKRRAGLLKDRQIVSCIKADCMERFTVSIKEDGFHFERRTSPITCKCGETTNIPEQFLLLLERDQSCRFICSCGAENLVAWKLKHFYRSPTSGG